MLELIKKALFVLRKRPIHFVGIVGQYFRFRRTKFLQPLFLTPSQGIFLGTNVRIQRVTSLIAERPKARIKIDENTIVYEDARLEAYGSGQITVGAGSILGDIRIYSRGSVTLGKGVMTSWNVFVQDFDPHPAVPELREIQVRNMVNSFKPSYSPPVAPLPLSWDFESKPIEIGDNVWIGANVTILKGAKIGAGCIVATGAVVPAGDWPARSILAGVPARVVKTEL